jgi:hypothetical protein
MRLPRLRFTVRRMMIVVAVLAGLLGIREGWQTHNRRWAARYGTMANEYHTAAGKVIAVFDREHPTDYDWDPKKWTDTGKRQWELIWELVYYRDCSYWLQGKHQRAVWHPWEYFASNPTAPPQPWEYLGTPLKLTAFRFDVLVPVTVAP